MTTGPSWPPPQPSGPTGPGRDAADISLLPTIGMVIRDGERLGAQLLALLNRDIDPASLPPVGAVFHELECLREVAGYHVEAALRALAAIAELPLPVVGSAVKVPVSKPTNSGPSPAGVAPVAPGRGAGPGYLGPVVPVEIPRGHDSFWCNCEICRASRAR